MQLFNLFRHRLFLVILFLTLLISVLNVSATPVTDNLRQDAAPAEMSQVEPLYPPPIPADLPPEVEEARARAAMEAALTKQLTAWNSEYQATIGEVKIEGAWAYGKIKRENIGAYSLEEFVVLAYHVNKTWQPLFPTDEHFGELVNLIPNNLLSPAEKEELYGQVVFLNDFIQMPQYSDSYSEEFSAHLIDPNEVVLDKGTLISDENFVSRMPRSEVEIEQKLEEYSSVLMQIELEPVNGYEISAASTLSYLGEMYGISPAILLTFVENEYGLLTQPDFSNDSSFEHELSLWLRDVSISLSSGFYEYYYGNELEEYTFNDGKKMSINAGNASTYALRKHFFSNLDGNDDWAQQLFQLEQDFLTTYEMYFGSALTGRLKAVHPPAEELLALTSLPSLKLPWEGGDTWYYTGGPHTFDGTGSLSGIDYKPSGYFGCSPDVASNRWIAASAAGRTVDYQQYWLKLDHDEDGNVNTGWLTVYGHIANRIGDNQTVQQGELLGNPSCFGGYATGVHVHFGIKYQNVWQPIEGTNISGWSIQNGQEAYHGYMTKADEPQRESAYHPGEVWDYSSAAVTSDNYIDLSPNDGWEANYYDNHDRWWDTNNDGNWKCSETIGGPELDKNYGSGAPCNGMDANTWIGDYASTIDFPSGSYAFYLDHDDGAKFWINDQNKQERSGSGNGWICDGSSGFSLNGNTDLRVMLKEDEGDAHINLTWTTDTSVCPSSSSSSWAADYYDNHDRWWDTNNDGNWKCSETIGGPELDKNYGSDAPCSGMDADSWIGDYASTIDFPSGSYAFYLEHDDGAKFWINDQNKQERSGSGDGWICDGSSGFPLNGNTDLRVMLKEDGGDARINLTWTTDVVSVCTLPPIANFDAWPQSGDSPLEVDFHNTSTGEFTSCTWDYGDGFTGSSCDDYHPYTYNYPGDFTVQLTVSGSGGIDSKTITEYITVNPPPLQVKLYDQANFAGIVVTALGTGFSNSPNANSYSMDIPSGWSVKTWLEDDRSGDMRCWRDSIANLQDHGWHLAIESIEIFDTDVCPPTANFEATPLSGDAPFEVEFRNTSVGEYMYCSWGYGDGEAGSSCNEYHSYTYNTPGTYMVQLFVSGLGGSDTKSVVDYITVTSSDPDLHPYSPSGSSYLVTPSSVSSTQTPNTLFSGQATYFDWHFVNSGNSNVTQDFHVELWVDDTRYIRYPFTYLGAGSYNGFYDWAEVIPDAGWHTVRLVTDPDNTILESDETNNEWSGDFYWTADLHEPNNSIQEATPISYGDTLDAEIGPIGDEDYYIFTGSQDDIVIVDIDATSIGSSLDSYIYILDDQGNELAFNDDAEGLDSKLGYKLPHNGTFYVKVRSYGHPNTGGPEHFYTMHFYTDNTEPIAEIISPQYSDWIDPNLTTISVSASDNESGIHRVEFLWHSDDWTDPDWVWLGADYYGDDGWSWNFDTSTLPEQRGGAFYIWAFDWGNSYGPAGVYNMGIDRTPPDSSVHDLPAITNSLLLMVVNWSGIDNLSGISSYDVQVRDESTGSWTDLASYTSQTYELMNIYDGHTYYFRSRARDEAGNLEAFPSGDGDAFTTIVHNTNCKTLTLNIDPLEGGNITADPLPDCDNGTKYSDGTVVELTATANSDYTFTNWSDGVSGTNTVISVTMDTDKVATANFEQMCYTLTLVANPAVGGNISANPTPNCNNGTQYSSGTVVELTAASTQGYEFGNWSGGVSGTSPATSLTMNESISATANFSEIQTCYTLTLTADTDAGGSISSNPPPNCNSGTQYSSGTVVQLTASSNPSYMFDSWSGDASGISSPTSVTMSENKAVTAHFTQIAGPHLRIYEDTSGYPEQTVEVPIFFTGNDSEITSMIFSVDFDQSCLSFDSTDTNGDGIPDGITFSTLAGFGKSATFESNDTDGEIDFIIADTTLPLATMPDGELLSIEFAITCYPSDYLFVEVNFAADPPVSFGDVDGKSAAGTSENGGVDVFSIAPGDCNSDYSVDAGDISAISLEIFDGDGADPNNASGGTFAGGPGCDANEDGTIDAGDITCTVLSIFGGSGMCGSSATTNVTMLPELIPQSVATGAPSLTVPNQTTVSLGDEVTIPVMFEADGHDISSLLFSLDFDETWLAFDPTDGNGDGVPDAIVFDVPGNFDASITFNASDADGELDFFIADIFPPLIPLSDTVVAYITFTAGDPTDNVEAMLKFSQEPVASFGNIAGQSVAGTTNDGSVLIQSNYALYLPFVLKP